MPVLLLAAPLMIWQVPFTQVRPVQCGSSQSASLAQLQFRPPEPPPVVPMVPVVDVAEPWFAHWPPVELTAPALGPIWHTPFEQT